MADDGSHKRTRDADADPLPQSKLHRTLCSITDVWKGFAPALRGEDKANFSPAIQWLTNVAQSTISVCRSSA